MSGFQITSEIRTLSYEPDVQNPDRFMSGLPNRTSGFRTFTVSLHFSQLITENLPTFGSKQDGGFDILSSQSSCVPRRLSKQLLANFNLRIKILIACVQLEIGDCIIQKTFVSIFTHDSIQILECDSFRT